MTVESTGDMKIATIAALEALEEAAYWRDRAAKEHEETSLALRHRVLEAREAGATLAQIAGVLGVSVGRVSQIAKEAAR